MFRLPLPTTVLLRCGMAAGPLFVAVWLLAGAVRPSYDPMRHPVSSLSLTGAGWVQIANFAVTGLLMLAFAAGVRRVLRESGRAGLKPWLVGAYGLGLVGAGAFVTDPVGGYPPNTPKELVYTWHGVVHDVFSLLVFLGLPLTCVVFSRWFGRRGRPGWAAYSLATAAAFLVAFLLAGLGFAQEPGWADYGGLYQRVSLVLSSAWFTLLALHLHHPRPHGRSGRSRDAG